MGGYIFKEFMSDEQAIYGDDLINYYYQMISERKSHDAEINRIAMELNLPIPSTIEDIVKEIRRIKNEFVIK
jgi:hypothetical protein